MLATAWPEPFDDPGWWFELKWDGYRILAEWDGDRLRLRSRRGNDLTAAFPELGGIRLARPGIIDGEVVVFDPAGRPSFHGLQQRNGLAGRAAVEASHRYPATMVAFDLLHDGQPLLDRPLEERRERLAAAAPACVVVADPLRGDGRALWSAVVERDLEGIVAKRSGSRYHPGRRSPDWRKVARRRTLRAVVGGFLPGEGKRSDAFGSLLVGLFDGDLRLIGAVGSGFDDRSLTTTRALLDRLVRPTPPFADVATVPRGAVWVEPVLVAVVEYKEWTPDRRLRAPVFKGWDEADPTDATWASEGPAQTGT